MILRPSASRPWPGSNGSIMPVASAVRRIHLSLLIVIAGSSSKVNRFPRFYARFSRLRQQRGDHLARDARRQFGRLHGEQVAAFYLGVVATDQRTRSVAPGL